MQSRKFLLLEFRKRFFFALQLWHGAICINSPAKQFLIYFYVKISPLPTVSPKFAQQNGFPRAFEFPAKAMSGLTLQRNSVASNLGEVPACV